MLAANVSCLKQHYKLESSSSKKDDIQQTTVDIYKELLDDWKGAVGLLLQLCFSDSVL